MFHNTPRTLTRAIPMSYNLFLLILLAMLSAFAPFVTDMYLPSLPSMEVYFHTTSSMVQLGLMSSMVGLAIGQIIFGPLSDKYGRRPLLLASIWLFIVSTVACLVSPSIMFFVAIRLLQGIGAAGGVVLSRSIATDYYEGAQLAKMLAIIGAINGVASVAAPVVGGLMTDWAGWQGIFVVILCIGLALLAGCIRFRETLPTELRSDRSFFHTFGSFLTIVRNRRYIFYTLQLALVQGILFGNIASSPFIVQHHYGFSALIFSFCFAINALVLGLGAAASVKFRTSELSTRVSSIAMCVISLVTLVTFIHGCNFWIYESLVTLMIFAMGLSFPSSTSLAMSSERRHAGSASALLGALCFVVGGLVSPLVGFGNMLVPTAIVFVVCAFASLACALYAERQRVEE